ncbi:NBS-LRR resistance-like protein [Artemisia annua]|uniref:NBS-LRR resistance-like protein n=1 Tax=Artemisia annua TaxID=35608 RepID=A0A2U1KTD7_ARTAN|nr:NBS-LRR resistance-like protein [Artemisia annua]
MEKPLIPTIFVSPICNSREQDCSSQRIHSELKKWERSWSQIRALLNNASMKEVTDKVVKQWLNSLQHLAYDIDDILDDMETEAMHHVLNDEPQPITSKVKKLIPTCYISFSSSTRMDDNLSHVTTRLQELVDEKKGFITMEVHGSDVGEGEVEGALIDEGVIGSVVGVDGIGNVGNVVGSVVIGVCVLSCEGVR